jgi:hypothetical protein
LSRAHRAHPQRGARNGGSLAPTRNRTEAEVIPAIALSIIAMIAGHPTQVTCDVPATAVITAWTSFDGQEIHMQESICAGLEEQLGTYRFAASISTLVHESAHARGVRSESCAETWVNVAVYDVLWRFYAVPFFTPLSEEIGAQVATITRGLPPAYQPAPTACAQEPGAGRIEELKLELERKRAALGEALTRANAAAERARGLGALAARSAGLNALYGAAA